MLNSHSAARARNDRDNLQFMHHRPRAGSP